MEIWHNPRCSKSRQTLALLQERGAKVKVRHYLENPPSAAELERALVALGLPPRDLMRQKETLYDELGLAEPTLQRAALVRAMVEHPRLIERPVVICGDRALVGRPPERVLAWFD